MPWDPEDWSDDTVTAPQAPEFSLYLKGYDDGWNNGVKDALNALGKILMAPPVNMGRGEVERAVFWVASELGLPDDRQGA
jgi:hypothetical protein